MKYEHQHILLHTARQSIKETLRPTQKGYAINLRETPSELTRTGASFVTLKVDGKLRGCIGTLRAYRPLIEDVVANATGAATRDERFKPLTYEESELLHIHISVLNGFKLLDVKNENELLSMLRRGIDGLMIEEGERCATFLPSVWESIGEPVRFLQELKKKAGLPRGYVSTSLKFYTYQVEEIKT